MNDWVTEHFNLVIAIEAAVGTLAMLGLLLYATVNHCGG